MRANSTIAILATMPLLGAASPQPMRLQPSSVWVLDYAENSCRLSRAFGTDADKTILEFETTAPGQLSILAEGRPLETSREEVPAKFLPVQDETFNGEPKVTVTNKPVVLWSGVDLLPAVFIERDKYKQEQRKAHPRDRPPAIDLEERDAERAARQAFASAATELEIETRRSRPVILETGSLGAAIKMFDKCSRDSLRDWGVDPDLDDKIVRRVWAPDVSGWFSPADYPSPMQAQGKESEVRVRLLVDVAGKISKCTSLSHYDEPDFNRAVCETFMKRGKFQPAELADGTKVPSYYINRVVFNLAR
jgi:TonB family protein